MRKEETVLIHDFGGAVCCAEDNVVVVVAERLWQHKCRAACPEETGPRQKTRVRARL